MPTIKKFEDIEAWQTARELTRMVYDLSGKGAFSKDLPLRDQIRRAAVAVMSNIAEGFENRTHPNFNRHIRMAKGSAGEVRSQAYVALDLRYISQAELDSLIELTDKCSRQLASFIRYLDAQPQVHLVNKGGTGREA